MFFNKEMSSNGAFYNKSRGFLRVFLSFSRLHRLVGFDFKKTRLLRGLVKKSEAVTSLLRLLARLIVVGAHAFLLSPPLQGRSGEAWGGRERLRRTLKMDFTSLPSCRRRYRCRGRAVRGCCRDSVRRGSRHLRALPCPSLSPDRCRCSWRCRGHSSRRRP